MSASPEFNGALIIDKPAGITSHDVVYRLRKILKTKKIGHTGTLDPFATGVLVMLVGKATRLARFINKDRKSYEALVQFGFETDTGDREGGRKTSKTESGVPPTKELIETVRAVLPDFSGEIEQVPPMYSAKKVEGKKLYELAREGVEIERKPISVSIYELGISGERVEDGQLRLHVSCSAGTYIRTLAEDIGKAVGIPCHLSELRRTRSGVFDISASVTIEELEQLAVRGSVKLSFVSMSELLGHLPLQETDDEEENRVAHGMMIDTAIELKTGQAIRLINKDGELLAVGKIDPSGMIQPKVVLISR